jgi:hypothetical protein
MKQGTISVLFGCHSIIHSIIVIIAWKKLYGRIPEFWQIICIFLHDIGHWGKNYLDDYEEKKQHAILGAKIAKWLFGEKGYELIDGHNPYNGSAKSILYSPDKYSWVLAPIWWMTSNAFFEPKLQRVGCSKRTSAIMFKDAMTSNMNNGFMEMGHDIYIKQCVNINQERSV